MTTATRAAGVLAALALATACSSLPDRIETLDQARSAVTELEQDELAREVSSTRYENAREALERAEEAYEENEPLELIEHEAYVALRNAQIAQQQIEEQRAREELERAEAERAEVLLTAREQEAEQARELAEERGEALEQETERAREAGERAEELAERTQQLEQEQRELEEQLADLQAEETDRGWVLTLEDVLFDFDAAELNPGADATMDRIAEFLNANPERNIVIEGHTDSTGSATYNQELSRERANAVRRALVERGVDAGRIETRGLGEEYPLATNESTAGRQLNRRVEVVVSGEAGEFPESEQRRASADPAEQQG